MKRVYWRPRAISQKLLLFICLLSLLGFLAVEVFKTDAKQSYYDEKLAATELAAQAMRLIKEERLNRGHDIDLELDPAETGMVGSLMTPVTTVAGHLGSKQTSTNPNFAAVIVEMLKEAGLKEGDLVAVGYSGSFPALNISLCTAIQTLKLKPIIIASAGASQFGANFPDLLCIDMERILYEHGFVSFRSVACSIGGYEDLGLGMSDEAHELVRESIKRNGLPLTKAATFTDAIDERMQIYKEHAKGKPIKTYVNVGGGTISVGRSLGKKLYNPGLNLRAPARATLIDSVMSRFMRQSIPVIHLVQVEELAVNYGLPLSPTSIPPIGEGDVYYREKYNRWLAGCVLLIIIFSLRAFVLTDFGFRLFKGNAAQKADAVPEPMV